MLATTMATANAQEAKMVSGKIRCTKNSEVTLPKGMKFTMRESGMRKSLTPIRPLKAATDEVQKAFYAVSEKLYKNAAPQGEPNANPNAGQAGQQAGGNDDGVVDADYEEVKDN